MSGRRWTPRTSSRPVTKSSSGPVPRAGSAGPVADLDQQLASLWQQVNESRDLARAAHDRAGALSQQLASTGDRVGAVDQRIGEIAGRLDGQGDVDRQISEIWSRIVGTEEQTRNVQAHAADLQRRLDDTDSSVRSFADISAQANTAEIDRQLTELRDRLDRQAQVPDRLADLDRRLSAMPDRTPELQQLQERLNQLAATMPDTANLSAQLASLTQRVSGSETDARAAREQARALDERIQNVSTQLANQLGELSREMDSIANQPAAAPVDDELLQTLRSGQVRLAAEQARYEISFREDLASLAEQVRQLRGRS